MGKPPNLKKKYAMSHAIATPTAREHITPMLFRYHRFAHAAEAVDQEIRCILAGVRTPSPALPIPEKTAIVFQ